MRLAFVTNRLGLGGTEKAMVAYAIALARQSDVRVVAVEGEGPRAEELREAGLPVACAGGDRDALAGMLEGVDAAYVFRAGTPEPLVPAAARAAGVPILVEYNIFGHVDASPDAEAFGCRLFISKMCAMRYRRQTSQPGPEFHQRNRVAYLPIDVARLRALAPSREEAKQQLGLDPARPVVGRIGRADDHKWRRILVDMVPALAQRAPDAQILLVGTTAAVRRRLASRGALERVRLLDPVVSESDLATYYAACDVLVHASSIGESQGVVLAEAMALGLPVVTNPTPWTDNAQIELVEEGVTGHVATHPRQFAEAVTSLLHDPGKRARMGAEARARADAAWDVGRQAQLLEELSHSLHERGSLPLDWSPTPAEVDDFAGEYERRLAAQFRPLTPRERIERALRDRVERLDWSAYALGLRRGKT